MVRAFEVEPELDDKEAEEELNNIYGDVEVCGIQYPSGMLLREVDPIAFRQTVIDLEDQMPHKWKCEECETEYDTEEEAEECCQEEEHNEPEEDWREDR